MQRASHLVRRFFVSVRGRDADPDDLAWARTQLREREWVLFERMTDTDQAHSIDVARRVERDLDGRTDDDAARLITAALLHDIGKIEAQAGVMMRVVATLVEPLARDAAVERWKQRSGPLGRLARQIGYPATGERLLRDAGAHEVVAGWAADHHRPSGDWRISIDDGRLLRAADDAAS